MQHKNMKDQFLKAIIYFSSGTAVVLLILIFGFIFSNGFKTLSFSMLSNDYWSNNYLVSLESGCQTYDKPAKVNGVFSECYGVAFEDKLSHEKKKMIVVTYVDSKSPFALASNLSAGPDKDKIIGINLGDQIEKISTDEGSIGMIKGHDSQTLVELMKTRNIESLYYKTAGGGIWGSLKATFILILLTLLFALPLGIGAAVYLEELAKDNWLTRLVISSIEMLAGIPSIIFGLMGLVVLFPITSLFGIDSTSILLGALTMSIMLLPIIIRSVQEALLVVPKAYRLSSLSLGANETQTIFKVVLPSALPGIILSILLSVSRIIGESAALIYTMGTFINDSPRINQGATTLAVHIWSIMASEQPNFELASAIAIVILAVTLILNLSLKFISNRIQRKLGLL